MKIIKRNKIFFTILAIFVASLSYSFYFQFKPTVDARAYDNIAWNLTRGFGYRESLDKLISEDHAIIRAGPGYEFFLAGIYKVFGHNYKAVWFLQALLHAFTAFLVFLIAKNIFNNENKTAIFAMTIYGFFPDLIIGSSMLLTETLSLFILAINTFIFLKYLDRRKFLYLITLSVFVPLMILVRSNLAIFILVFIPVFLKDIKKNFARAIIFSFIFIAVFLPWTIRNYFMYNEIIPTTVLIGNNLAMGNHTGATGEQLNQPYAPVEDLYKVGYIEGDKLAVKFALNFIREHPFEFLKISFYRISIYFSAARPASFWPNFSSLNKLITSIFSSVWSFLVFVLGIVGILFCFKNRNGGIFSKEKFFYFFALAIFMPLSVIFIVVETRYRFPVYLFLSVFSGVGLNFLFQKKKEIVAPIFYALIFVSLNTVFDASRNFNRVAERISEFFK